jgi:valyl-tRNA synthetase
LDTWFSSGLWPFATVGWPQQENDGPQSDLARFYADSPSACLETGYDILFFWVARMAMMGLELTGKVPFDVVYMHGLVRAADGSKMSKTKGNVIDPVDTVEKFGADSLRYSLVTGVTPGQDIPLNMEKIEANKMFANKLHNIAKFIVDNALKDDKGGATYDSDYAVTEVMDEETFESLPVPEQWIVSKCHRLVESCTEDIESYQLGQAGQKVYEFLRDDLADWYLEISKTRLYEGLGGDDVAVQKMTKRVVVYVFDRALRVLHPYMPFVTENLWQHIPKVGKTIMLADWPMMEGEVLPKGGEGARKFELFQALVRSIRNARAEYNVDQGKKVPADFVVAEDMVELVEREMAR